MSNVQTVTDTKKPAPIPVVTGKPPSAEAIPVKRLMFLRENGHDFRLGGGNSLNHITAGGQANRGTWLIFFEPRFRHHRATWTPPTGPATTIMIPESWCWFEPLE